MSSINFNASAMVALDTLRGINKGLGTVQSEISTGKHVSNAKDNAAVWAISKVMQSDVSGFAKVAESLSLGSGTVAVARAGAEQVESILQDMKDLVVSGQEESTDKTKIQTDIDRLKDQLLSIVDGAQFNGVNLLKAGDELNILGSLDRSDAGVAASRIGVSRQDLGAVAKYIDQTAGVFSADVVGTSTTLNATQTATLTIDEAIAGRAYSLYITGSDADSSNFTSFSIGGNLAASDDVFYVAREGDTESDIAAGLAAAFATYAAENSFDTNVVNITNSAGSVDLTLTSTVTDGTDTIIVEGDTVVSDDNVAGGGLAGIADLDVTSEAGATAALTTIETAIQTAIDAAAEFGSAGKRIENQQEFVGKLMDAMKAGISALTDTNMEEASARLQSLQVQQQLGVQALSIANGAPQAILGLFR